MVTLDQLSNIYTNTDDSVLATFVEPINKVISKFQIDSVAMFLAQMGHESNGLSILEENLNYRADRLSAVFPRYFSDVDPSDYAHNPEKIANRVYANRMGNGDEDSGDGWKFHGRGAIQLTGHDNYVKFAHDMGMNTDDVPDYLLTPEGAIMSAGWFWDSRNIDDAGNNVHEATHLVNGGENGLAERTALFETARSVLG